MYQRRNLGDVYTNPDRSVIFTNLVMYTITSKIKIKKILNVFARGLCVQRFVKNLFVTHPT